MSFTIQLQSCDYNYVYHKREGGGGWAEDFLLGGGVHFLRESRGNLLLLFDVLSIMSFSDNSDQKIL